MQVNTKNWSPAQQKLWDSLPATRQREIAQKGPEKAITWVEQELQSSLMHVRGTVGAGQMTGRADKLRSPTTEIPQGDATLLKDFQSQMRSHSMGFVGQVAQASAPKALSGDKAINQAKAGFQEQVKDLATTNPEGFQKLLQQVYGDKLTPDKAASLSNDAKAGHFPMPANVRFADNQAMGGANAAYSPKDGGTIYLNEALASKPAALQAAFAEEVGHHLDKYLGGEDSLGDEGQMFLEGLTKGGPLEQEALDKGRSDRDGGSIRVDGKEVQVEFQTSVDQITARQASKNKEKILKATTQPQVQKALKTPIKDLEKASEKFQGVPSSDRVKELQGHIADGNRLMQEGKYQEAKEAFANAGFPLPQTINNDLSNLSSTQLELSFLTGEGKAKDAAIKGYPNKTTQALNGMAKHVDLMADMAKMDVSPLKDPPTEGQIKSYMDAVTKANPTDPQKVLEASNRIVSGMTSHVGDVTFDKSQEKIYYAHSKSGEVLLDAEGQPRRFTSQKAAAKDAEETNKAEGLKGKEKFEPFYFKDKSPDEWNDLTSDRKTKEGRYESDCEGMAYLRLQTLGRSPDWKPAAVISFQPTTQGKNRIGHTMAVFQDKKGDYYLTSNDDKPIKITDANRDGKIDDKDIVKVARAEVEKINPEYGGDYSFGIGTPRAAPAGTVDPAEWQARQVLRDAHEDSNLRMNGVTNLNHKQIVP